MRRLIGAIPIVALAVVSPRAADAPPRPDGVTYVNDAAVSAAFAKGTPLIEVRDYKIHASRREQAGQPEIHVRDTGVIYIVEGGSRPMKSGARR